MPIGGQYSLSRYTSIAARCVPNALTAPQGRSVLCAIGDFPEFEPNLLGFVPYQWRNGNGPFSIGFLHVHADIGVMEQIGIVSPGRSVIDLADPCPIRR